MGRSRQRNKPRIPFQPARNFTKSVQPQLNVTIDSISPVCPGAAREGLDGLVFMALKKLDSFLRDMRNDLGIPNGVWDEGSAVKRYLAYLSVMVDTALADMALSSTHKNDIPVLVKQRLLVEYAAKAKYFADHPDYALYMMTIHEAQSVLSKAQMGAVDGETLASLRADLQTTKTTFARVAHLKKRQFDEIMREIATNDDYAWLYAAPSALMHGDPEGIRQVFQTDPDGAQRIVLDLPDKYLNAAMVDSGSNSLMFCKVFMGVYHLEDKALADRANELDKLFKELVLKHSYGRDEEALEQVRCDLKAM